MNFFLCENGRNFRQKSVSEVFEKLHVDAHFAYVLFVLRCRRRAEADSVAIVIENGTGHNGVKVDYANGFARNVVHKHVVELCVVVRNP